VIISILARIKAGLEVEHFETVRVRKDRTVFPVLLTVSPIRDADGTVVGASTITRDVTREKDVFVAARDVIEQKQAAQYSRSLLEAALDPLVTISPTGMITDVNEATVKVTGIPAMSSSGPASPTTSPNPTRPTTATSSCSTRDRSPTTR